MKKLFLARCQKSRRELEFKRFCHFLLIKECFGKLKNRLGMIPVRLLPLLCAQHTEIGLSHGNSNHSRENQYSTPLRSPNDRCKTLDAPSLSGLLRMDWRNGTR
ncbi:hypothetical protein E2C01_057731 [Portunus trituberculatus]|uniref:Uncharacterized protein n=1 Tax=Portunus trituberculatus TaxID=210409 RepID=A0A5B7GTS3_PORTR|nr:hypothetical protein [Portunus trituberculatus]